MDIKTEMVTSAEGDRFGVYYVEMKKKVSRIADGSWKKGYNTIQHRRLSEDS